MRDAQARTVYLKDYQVPDFVIDETHLDVALFEEESFVTASLHMRRNPLAESRQAKLVLHGEELELLHLELDGRRLAAEEYVLEPEALTVRQVPDSFVLKSRVRIRPQENTSLEGLYKSKRMFCTQCEAEGFRKITYYLDRPDAMSVFTTRIEAEQNSYPVLLANGNKIDSGICTETEKAGRHWVVWQDPFRKPAYLFALVAGSLEAVTDSFTTMSGREVSLQIFVEAKDLDKCDFAMQSLKKAMRWDEEVYGREYDLDIFMIVAVDDFNMGAMENKGLNIFNSSCVLARPETSTDFSFQRIEAIVAHEYFHNWSGNRVTCRDWFQLSLKEGFTVYRDSEFSADMGSRAVKRIDDVNYLRTVQFAEDAGPMAHPVRPASYMEISNFYTVTIYEKGAEVVRMLANLLGPALFRKGTDRYFEKFDGMAVTTEDFVATMEEVSGMDLQQFRRWYTQAGTPVLKVSEEFSAAEQRYTLRVGQSCPPTPGQSVKEPFYIPLRIGLLDPQGRELPLQLAGEPSAGATSRVLVVSETVQDFVFTGVQHKPVPSLLREFSAPVKLEMPYSRQDLLFLMRHDSDGFVRWEAFQQLALLVLDDLLKQYQAGQSLQADASLLTAMQEVLQAGLASAADHDMLSRLLLLPSEAYIAELAAEIDVDGIHDVREFLRLTIARQLEPQLTAVYQALNDGSPWRADSAAAGRRALKNTALAYLALLPGRTWAEACFRQYEQADNMTDQSAALRCLIAARHEEAGKLAEKALTGFYEKWQHEALVMEQWLSMQAGAVIRDNLPKVKALMEHAVFDIRNPNKVRSVIGAFSQQNRVGFHHKSGSGYRFLAEQVLRLDALNPQIAARLVTPLTSWKKYDVLRQRMMKNELQTMLDSGKLSKDLYEVVSKSLSL